MAIMPPDGLIIVIDDHDGVRLSLRALLESAGLQVQDFADAAAFLSAMPPNSACLVVDVRMPGMSGLELQEELVRRGLRLPLIIGTGHADVGLAVKAMKAGALDFLEKPYDEQDLLASVQRAIAQRAVTQVNFAGAVDAAAAIASLTERERDVLDRLTLGESNKQAAHHLGISPRTVEIHRARVLEKLKASSLSDLVRIAHQARQF